MVVIAPCSDSKPSCKSSLFFIVSNKHVHPYHHKTIAEIVGVDVVDA